MKYTMKILAAAVAIAAGGCATDNVAWHNVNHLNSANPPTGINTPGTAASVELEPTKPFYPVENGSYGVSGPTQAYIGEASGTGAVVPTTSADLQFMQTAMSDGVFEINASQEALRKSSDASVHQVARTLIQDGTRRNDQLSNMARLKGASLKDAMTPEQEQQYEALQAATGANFDQLYLSQMTHSHDAELAEFQNESAYGNDPDVRLFADSHVPDIRGQWEMITAEPAYTSER